MKILWVFLLICSCSKNNARKETAKPAETGVSAKESESLMKYEEYLEELGRDLNELPNGNYAVLDKYFNREKLWAECTLTNVIICITGSREDGERVSKIEEIFLTNAGKITIWQNRDGALFLNDEELLISLEEWESLPMTCKTFQEKLRSFYLETDNQILQSRIEEFFDLDLFFLYIGVASLPPDSSDYPDENGIMHNIMREAYKKKTDLYYYIMDKLILPQDPEKRRTALLNMIAYSFSTSELRRIYQGTVRWYLSENWLCPEINDQSQTKW